MKKAFSISVTLIQYLSCFQPQKKPLVHIMFLCSSVGSLASRHTRRTDDGSNDEHHSSAFLDVAPSSSSDDASSTDLSAYQNVHSESNYHHSSRMLEDDDYSDALSYGGTIIASLSSREVAHNLRASSAAAAAATEERPRRKGVTTHHLSATETHNRTQDGLLPDMATVRSDALSFTPTMAEHALSLQLDTVAQRTTTSVLPSEDQRPNSTTESSYRQLSITESPPPTIGGGEGGGGSNNSQVQPAFCIACPFCDREKDLQWRLTQEQEQTKDLKLSEHRTRFLLGAIIAMVVVAVVSFFIGKAVSDMQSQEVLSQYMTQCNDMVSHRDEEELYWKLVTAAFSAVVHAMAGPLANVVLGGVGGK